MSVIGATPDPSVAALDILVGSWNCDSDNSLEPGTVVRTTATFEWMDGGRFLIERSSGHPPFPSGLSLIGRTDPDDPSSPLVMHYFDSRGVARLYTVTLEGKVWTIARDGSDFSQRYHGTFSEDGNTFTGTWERSDGEGMPLHHDFDLVYRRIV
jgi:hypothetical protein